jgi:asparagine synthase (glutamine-hydrolysing)
MCGIVGSIQIGEIEPYRDEVRQAMARLAHRGPDGEGYKEFALARGAGSEFNRGPEATVLFGHRRLAIIDLSEGASQPMSTPDSRFHLIFNGEIYNYRELRTELQNLGQRFRTNSDSEVLLLAWQEWGTAILPRLIGMFSFAVLDCKKSTVVLARDPFGIKPLYYVRDGKSLVFASEISPLLDLKSVSRRANLETVYEFLGGGFGDYADRTFFQDVRQLPPAHYLAISCGSPGAGNPTCYWELGKKQGASLSADEATSCFRALFETSIKLHLRSDVPAGVSLSGGTDSSAITAMVRKVQGPNSELHTVSYVADDSKLSEERWSTMVARATSAKQHLVRVQASEIISDFQRLVQVQEQPFGSPTIYAQYRIFRCAQEACLKVMLTGQGADQYLGYIRHLSVRLASMVRTGRWVAAVKFLGRVRSLPLNGALNGRTIVRHLLPESIVAALRRWRPDEPFGVNVNWFRNRGVGQSRIRPVQGYSGLHGLLKQSLVETLPSLLRFEDRNAMAFSVENRVPFLTTDLLDLIFALPEEEIISNEGRCKAVLVRAMRGVVPDEVLDRRDKIGFAMPLSDLNRSAMGWLETILSHAASIPVFNVAEIQNLLRLTRIGQASDAESQRMIWRWVSFLAWAREFGVSFE